MRIVCVFLVILRYPVLGKEEQGTSAKQIQTRFITIAVRSSCWLVPFENASTLS